MKSFVKELRDAAMACPDILLRKLCKDIADEVQMHVLSLNACPTAETMQLLNAAWVRAVNILEKTRPAPTTPPRSDAATEERKAA